MIRAAFYAPLKPPDHPVASGDRTMARALCDALLIAGIETELASRLQNRDGAGDPARQDALFEAAEVEARRLIDAGARAGWRLWITYHNYYKAPDLLGPVVAKALGLPYVLIEATRAKKRLAGAWARFAQAAEAACDAASLVFYLTERDAEALRRDAPPGQNLVHLRPFLPAHALPPASQGGSGLLSVGMMRPGDKLASYTLIAESLAALETPDWQITLVGDGAARKDVEALMAPFGSRVRFLGALDGPALAKAYAAADLFFWPGFNEAFGMVYLEAQAHGLPVVAQDRPGLRDLLAPGTQAPPPEAGPPALARAVDHLLGNTAIRAERASAARAHVAAHHLRPAAASLLGNSLRGLCP